MTTRLWALVPLKNLDGVKTRLSGLLSPSARRELALAMARDVAAALAQSRTVERVVLVSSVPDLPHLLGVPGISTYCGAESRGLNEDLGDAAHWAREQGATHALIAHADLPLLSPAAIDRFAAPLRGGKRFRGLRAASCKQGSGTNLLLAPLPLPLPLVFGRDSLARFRAEAAQRGLALDVRHDPLLAADIDELGDYEALEDLFEHGGLHDGATAALLHNNRSVRQRTDSQVESLCAASAPGSFVLSSV